LDVELSGQMFGTFKQPASEGIGVLAAIFILLIAFGSLLAMGLPIVTAVCGIAIGVAIVEILANFMSVPNFASEMAAMIGLGVGITGLSIDRYRLHRRGQRGTTQIRESMWHRWSRVVQAHPWPPFIAALAVLLLLAAPVFSLRMGSTDAGNDPMGETTRQAYDL